MTLLHGHLATPLGSMRITVDGGGALREIYFLDHEPPTSDPLHGLVAAVTEQLVAYLAGARRRFDLPLAASGTPFQRRVWDALVAIPYGETRSYGQLATALGSPGAARAVGRASATNPIPIVIPCHRLVGSDGSLTGFGGGLHWKAALLALERGDSPLDAAAALRRSATRQRCLFP